MARVPLYIGRVKLPLSFDMSISSQAFADSIHFGLAAAGLGGAYVAMENPAFNRAVQILAGTIASLPLKTYHWDSDKDAKEPSTSFMDQWPGGPGRMSPFSWKEQVVMHLVTAGAVLLPHVHDSSPANNLIGLVPFGPLNYIPRWEGPETAPYKVFKVTLSNGKQLDFGDGCENAIEGRCATEILGPSFNGMRPVSPMWEFRNSIALAQALDTASRRLMTNGLHVAALIAAKAGAKMDAEDAEALQKAIDETLAGPEQAGGIHVTNGEFDVHQLTLTNQAAQFIEQREFAIHEAARMLGVPTHLLFSSSPDQSFASGLAEQWGAFARITLMPITSRIEEAVSPVIGPSTKFIEFDYKGLLQGTPESEVKLILQQVDAGLMSEEEARELLGLGPKDPLDTFRTPAPVPPSGKLPEIPQASSPAASNGNGKLTNMPSAKMRS